HHRRFMWCRFAYVLAVTLFGAFAQTPCEQLKMLKLTRMAITQAESKAAGPLQSSDNLATAAAQMLPSYCRVAATLTPTSDSDIKMEVWLPASAAWNGKFEAVGGGGWAGGIEPATGILHTSSLHACVRKCVNYRVGLFVRVPE